MTGFFMKCNTGLRGVSLYRAAVVLSCKKFRDKTLLWSFKLLDHDIIKITFLAQNQSSQFLVNYLAYFGVNWRA